MPRTYGPRLLACCVLLLAVALATTASAAPSLREWLTGNGAKLGDWRVGASAATRQISPHTTFHRPGLFSETDLHEGAVVAEIPSSLLLHVNSPYSVAESPCGALIDVLRQSKVTDPYCLLSLRLLYEHHLRLGRGQPTVDPAAAAADPAAAAAAAAATPAAPSFFESYISTLAARPQSLCFFEQSAISELQLPQEAPLLAAREQHLKLMHGLHTVLAKVLTVDPAMETLFPSDSFSETSFRWAYGNVLSAAAELPLAAAAEGVDLPDLREAGGAGAGTTGGNIGTAETLAAASNQTFVALVPLFNLLNHANPERANLGIRVFPGTPTAPAPAAGAAGAAGANAAAPAVPLPRSIQLYATRKVGKDEELTLPFGTLFHYHRLAARGLASKEQQAAVAAAARADGRSEAEVASLVAAAAASTPRAQAADAPIELTPAPLSNTQLLLHFGTALPVNTAETVALEVGLEAVQEPPRRCRAQALAHPRQRPRLRSPAQHAAAAHTPLRGRLYAGAQGQTPGRAGP